MEAVLEFIQVYWKYIGIGIVLILDVIILVFRKKPIKLVDGVVDVINEILPTFMNIAEATELKGQDKKDYVVLRVIEALCSLGYDGCDKKYVQKLISDRIELYLSTPSKKVSKED